MSRPTDRRGGSARTLWLGVALLFGLLAIAWSLLFFLASRNPVESVPLVGADKP